MLFELIVQLAVIATVWPMVHCGFFDLTDVDDPLALLWQNKHDAVIGTIAAYKNKRCTTPDGLTGTCMHQAYCLLQQGTSYRANQDCGVLSTCCITAQDDPNAVLTTTTRARVSYFTNNNNKGSHSTSQHVVEVINSNICQMRLDFLTFSVSQASEVLGTNPDGTPANRQVCQSDFLSIQPNYYGIPVLCGENTGQHLYVHLNKEKQVTLTMHLRTITPFPNTDTNSIIGLRNWNIKITQLECPGPHQWLSTNKFVNNHAFNDFPVLAPAGAIQYFTNPTGIVESFGYPDTYINGLNYAIAFKKTPTTSCIDFLANPMRIRHTPAPAATGLITDTECIDYLAVPGLTNIQQPTVNTFQFDYKMCFDNTDVKRFSEVTPGPLYISFFSANSYPTAQTPVHSFRLQYSLNANCN